METPLDRWQELARRENARMRANMGYPAHKPAEAPSRRASEFTAAAETGRRHEQVDADVLGVIGRQRCTTAKRIRAALGIAQNQISLSLARLKQRGEIVAMRSGFGEVFYEIAGKRP